jgi:hypothetical protein
MWAAVKLTIALFLLGVLAQMHAPAYFTSFLLSQPVAITSLLVEGGGLLLCLWLAWRRPNLRPWTVAVSATLLFAGSFQYVPLTVWMRAPPAPEVCDGVIQTGHVERLTPAGWAAEPSQPFSLLYIPEEGWLLGVFKMGGDGSYSFWSQDISNRIMGVDVRDPGTVKGLSLGGPMIANHVAYRPDTREALVSRQGGDTQALDVVSLADFPELKKVRSIPVDNAPNILITHPTEPIYGVLSEHGVFTLRHNDRFEALGQIPLTLSPEHVPVVIWEWHAAGSTTLYLSVLFYPFIKVDMDTREVQWSPDTYGGGQLVGHPPTGEVFVTDMLLDRLDVLDMERLEPVRGLALDYTPRAIEIDPSRDLLMIGAWFGGTVEFYRLSTLEPLGLSVPVGPILRDLAIDTERGLLFAATKCGIYQVHLDAVLTGDEG